VEMRVGMQPGDNYRVAATVFPSSQLGSLQSTDATVDGYVSAYTDVIRSGFNGALSPMLTVWRKLHLEMDSMTAPPPSGPEANFVTEKILAIKPNQPNPGQTTLHLRFRNPPFQNNRFGNGSLAITGAAANYAVASSGSEYFLPGYQCYVIVTGLVPTNLVNASCILRDDDDLYLADQPLYPSTLGLQSPPLPLNSRSSEFVEGIGLAKGLRHAYLPAFIEVIDANALGWNGQMTIPFRLNQKPVNLDTSSYFDNGNLSLKGADHSVFWAYSVVFGYQADESQDGDPNAAEPEPLKGGSPYSRTTGDSYGYSVIFAEAIREQAFRLVANPSTFATQDPVERQRLRERYYYDEFFSVVAHEIGHAPGQFGEDPDHLEDGVMASGAGSISGAGFSPKSIKRFRTGITWTRE